ncbi:MAG: hypothetical protein M3Y82_01955 [Verrucomicrobiota bacterium]|nr:hypothetical protein [Verrucomicrobiota bacterium]
MVRYELGVEHRFFIDQPAELNKYVLPSKPFGWEERRQILAIIWPFIFIMLVIMVEGLLMRQWKGEMVSWQRFVAAAFLCPILFLLVFEGKMRLARRSEKRKPRRVILEEKKVRFGPLNGFLWWKSIIAWEFEPLAERPDLTKLTIRYQGTNRRRRERTWPLVLNSDDLKRQLVSHLETKIQNESSLNFKIKVFDSPRPAPTKPPFNLSAFVRFAFFWTMGFLFFAHGLAFLCVAIDNFSSKENLEKQKIEFRTNILSKTKQLEEKGIPKEQITGLETVVRWSTSENLTNRHFVLFSFCFLLGLNLLILGIIFFAFGILWNWRAEFLQSQSNKNNFSN